MKKIKNLFRKNLFVLLLFILIIPTFMSLVRPGFFTMHDDLQAFRVYEMDKCFQDFQFPCRWVPDMGYQYGYPQYNYYPPGPFYLGEVFHLIGFQFIDAAKILFILGFITSAFAMYLFLKSWLNEISALMGALFYAYAPYKAVDVYVRGALNEFWSLTFFPLAFWASYKLIKEGKKRNLAYFGISVAGLLLTHNLMTMIFIPVLGVWVLTNLFLEKKFVRIKGLILGAVLGLGLAAFFTLPVFVEKPYAHLESLVGGYFDYRQHFVNLEQLFISNYWGYGSSVWGDNDELSLSTGQIHFLVSMFAVLLAAFLYSKFKKVSVLAIALFLTELVVLFMTHQKSSPIWSALGFLEFLQFPWRFLAISIFLLSTLAGVIIYFVDMQEIKFFKVKASHFLSVALFLGLVALYGSFFRPHTWLDISDQDKFTGKSWDKQLTISIFDYLPIYAKLPPTKAAPLVPEVLEGQAEFKNYRKGSDFQMGQVESTSSALIRLPLFDFPGMKVKLDGKEISFVHDDCRNEEFCLGLITLKIPAGVHTLDARLTDTPIRLVGNIFSVISFGVLCYLFLKKDEKTTA